MPALNLARRISHDILSGRRVFTLALALTFLILALTSSNQARASAPASASRLDGRGSGFYYLAGDETATSTSTPAPSTPTATPTCCNAVTATVTTTCNGTSYNAIIGVTNSCPQSVEIEAYLALETSQRENGIWNVRQTFDSHEMTLPPGYIEYGGPVWQGPLPAGDSWWRVRYFVTGVGPDACWSTGGISSARQACDQGTITPATATSTATRTPSPSPATATPTSTPECDFLAWRSVTSPDIGTLHGVKAISSNDVWAVGDGGILHWDGSTWNPVSSPATGPLYGVAGTGANDVWAVGPGGILHWDGVEWSMSFATVQGEHYQAAAAISPTDAWVVGYGPAFDAPSGMSSPLTKHWNGTKWDSVTIAENGNLSSIVAFSPNDIWAGGVFYNPWPNAQVMHWNGSQWGGVSSGLAFPCIWPTLSGISGISATDLWAVWGCNDRATSVMHYDGTLWSQAETPAIGSLNTVSAFADNAVWAGGDGGIIRWDGSAWSIDYEGRVVNAIDARSPYDVWAVGDGILHYTEAGFADVPPENPFYQYIQCLACRGIIGGYGDGTFRPNEQVTRGQLAKIVSNSAAFNDDPGEQIYEDVAPSTPFYAYINRLSSRGYISGYPCGGTGEPCGSDNKPYFRPNTNATRAQLSKIVSNAAGFDDTPPDQIFADVAPDHTFYIWIERLASRDIIGGYPCGDPGEPCDSENRPYFRPYNNVTRGQTAKIDGGAFFPDCQTSIRK